MCLGAMGSSYRDEFFEMIIGGLCKICQAEQERPDGLLVNIHTRVKKLIHSQRCFTTYETQGLGCVT